MSVILTMGIELLLTLCNINYYSDASTELCQPCFSYCSYCTSGKNGDCTTCGPLNYMNPETGLCLGSCPLGYSIQGSQCSAVNINLAVVFVFTKLTNVMLDNSGFYSAYMGSTDLFVGNFDVNDPYPIYNRGLYFTGNSFVKISARLNLC